MRNPTSFVDYKQKYSTFNKVELHSTGDPFLPTELNESDRYGGCYSAIYPSIFFKAWSRGLMNGEAGQKRTE